MKKPYVLITRPADEALPIAALAEERGWEAVIEPMLQIVPQEFSMPEDYPAAYHGIVFTSANAARVAGWKVDDKSLPAYCVGGRTAETAAGRGWDNVISADGDVAALNELLAGTGLGGDKKLLHLSGADIAAPVVVDGITVTRIPVYKASQAEKFSTACFDLLMRQKIDAALFFSVRAAEAFVALARQYGCQDAITVTKALCLANSMVKSLQPLAWKEIRVAQRPDREALIALLDKEE